MKAALVLVGCAACSLGGQRPNYQYFVLTSRATPGSPSASAGPAQRTLGIDQVTIPGYLDREQIASRTTSHHLAYSTTDRWAEPLDQAFERTLREDLAARLVPRGIQVSSRGEAPTCELTVEVRRFEQSGPDHVELWARWVVRSDQDVVATDETRTRVAMPGRDSNAMAAALSEAIARMATEIADRVQRAELAAGRAPDPR
ncbi:MAG TPA: PqiC family protein [Kofleriaceae bacterium]|jgi:hypothetical protein|nr:PqiC family protein [Kofleriaceae bacterium]